MRRLVPFAIVGAVMVMSSTAEPCTTFLAEHGGKPLFGKNYDWSQSAGLVTINPRGLQKTAVSLNPVDTPARWTAKYGSVTFNQYGVEMPNGGLNEKGLAIEIMWLDATRYPPADTRPTVNELQWIQRALDLFASVAELAQDAPSLRVSQIYAKVHYLACDASADCASFEYVDGQLIVTRKGDMPAKTLANDTYASSAAYLVGFTGFGGTKAMPSSVSSLDRFVRASMLARTTTDTTVPDSAFAILDKVTQPSTVWSIVYAPADGTVAFRTAAVPKVKSVNLAGTPLACGKHKLLDIDTDTTGDVTTMFTDYSLEQNRRLLERSLASIASQMPTGAIDLLSVLPESFQCAPVERVDAGSETVDASDHMPAADGAVDASEHLPAADGAVDAGNHAPTSDGCSCALSGRASRTGAVVFGLCLGICLLLPRLREFRRGPRGRRRYL
jgi:penicillin V acylase-like amidase (Ntn superfamily)